MNIWIHLPCLRKKPPLNWHFFLSDNSRTTKSKHGEYKGKKLKYQKLDNKCKSDNDLANATK